MLSPSLDLIPTPTQIKIESGSAVVNPLLITQTWVSNNVTYGGLKFTITDTASAAASLAFQILGGAAGATNLFSVSKIGQVTVPMAVSNTVAGLLFSAAGGGSGSSGFGAGTNTDLVVIFQTAARVAFTASAVVLNSGVQLAWNNGTYGATNDVGIKRNAAGILEVNSNAAGTFRDLKLRTISKIATASGASLGVVASADTVIKSITAIADAVATATFTVTVPNAAHSAAIKVTLEGSLGAGGAIGANEATGTIAYDIAIARTAGVATVATFSTAYGSATSSVAGAATITITAAASAISGAVSATQTFTIDVTISRGSGSSTNHTCQVLAEVINANATGVTIT
jgi:hypothetical protein